MNILGLDHKTISMQAIYLTDIIGDIMNEKEGFLTKAGKIKEYTFPRIIDDQV